MEGLGPGIFNVLLTTLSISLFFNTGSPHLDMSDAIELGMFTLIALLVSMLTEFRARAERQARLEREQLRITLASIGDAVIVTDASGAVTFLNQVGEALTGWSLEEARGQSVADVFRIINAGTRQSVESPVARVLRDGQIVGLANHTLLIARDGAERPIDDSGAPICNAAGELSGVVMVFRDISEREEAAALREQLLVAAQAARTQAEATQARIADILESITDGFLAFDREWRFTYLNREGRARLAARPKICWAKISGRSSQSWRNHRLASCIDVRWQKAWSLSLKRTTRPSMPRLSRGPTHPTQGYRFIF